MKFGLAMTHDTCQGGLTFLIPLSALLKMMIFVFLEVGCVSSLEGKFFKKVPVLQFLLHSQMFGLFLAQPNI